MSLLNDKCAVVPPYHPEGIKVYELPTDAPEVLIPKSLAVNVMLELSAFPLIVLLVGTAPTYAAVGIQLSGLAPTSDASNAILPLKALPFIVVLIGTAPIYEVVTACGFVISNKCAS